MKKATSGFTIVELLIVIVIIGILAAITVVAYNGITNRTNDAAVKNDLSQFAKTIELARLDTSDGNYPAVPTPAMGIKVTKSAYQTNGRYNWYYCVTPDRTQYALGAVSKSNRAFSMSSVNGLQEYSNIYSTETCNIIGVNPPTASSGYVYISSTNFYWANWTN